MYIIGQEYQLSGNIEIEVTNIIDRTIYFATYYSNGRKVNNQMSVKMFADYLAANNAELK